MPYEKTAHELSQPPPPPTEVSLLFKGWDTGLLRIIANLFLSSLPDNFLPPIYTPGGWRERHRESNVDKNKTHRTWHALKSGLVTMR